MNTQKKAKSNTESRIQFISAFHSPQFLLEQNHLLLLLLLCIVVVVAALFTNRHIFSWQRRSTHRARKKNVLRRLATLRSSICACFILLFSCHFQFHDIVNNLFHVFFRRVLSALQNSFYSLDLPVSSSTNQPSICSPTFPNPQHLYAYPSPTFFHLPRFHPPRHLCRLTLPTFLLQNTRAVTCFIQKMGATDFPKICQETESLNK